jgi:O-antigen/teichoic acid export membrane protein
MRSRSETFRNTGVPSADEAKQRAVRSAKWALLNSFVPRLLTLVLTTVLARLLTPDDFGLVGIATLVVSLMAMVQQTGLGQALVQRQVQVEEAASVTLWFNLTLSAALYGVLWLLTPLASALYEEPRLTPVLRVLGVQLVVSALGIVHTSLMARHFRFQKLFLIQSASTTAPFLIAVPLALSGLGYWALIYGSLAGTVVSTSLAWWLEAWRPRPIFDMAIARQMSRFGGFVFLEAFLGWMLIYFDNAVVGKVLGTKALGIYALAFNLAIAVVSIPISAVTGLTLSMFSRMQNDSEALKHAYLVGTRLVATYAIPAGVGLALVAKPGARLLFGERWDGLGTTLSVLALYSGFGHLWTLNSDAFKAIGRPDIMPKLYIPLLAVMIPAYVISAHYGLMAFTIARSLVVVVSAVPHTWCAVHFISVPRRYLWDACHSQIIPTLLMAIFLFTLTQTSSFESEYPVRVLVLILAPLLGLFVYLSSLYLLDRPLFLSIRSLIKTSILSEDA